MTPAATAKARRRQYLARIDRLQRQIAYAHRLALDDILATGVRTLAHSGGYAYGTQKTPSSSRTARA